MGNTDKPITNYSTALRKCFLRGTNVVPKQGAMGDIKIRESGHGQGMLAVLEGLWAEN